MVSTMMFTPNTSLLLILLLLLNYLPLFISTKIPLPRVSYQQNILMRPKGSQNPRAATNVVLVSEQCKYLLVFFNHR